MERLYKLIIAVSIMFLPAIALAADDNVPRITKEELKAKMDKGEEVLVLDVRTGGSYTGSKIKIKEAIRFAPNDIDVWSKNLPKDKEIITYCT
ncbi:MAG: hypothetical protein A2Z89_07960 [Deltaproteobacteria bacterium GWA2_43_19]|nr:MAG: hypothetical protein A2Z89_07960 [Deltaproteobacteria bacterium GWA2_43_19]